MITNNELTVPRRISHEAVPILFSDISEKDLLDLYKICQTKMFQKDEVIFENSNHISSLYVVVNGSVRLSSSVDEFTHNMDLISNQIFGLITSRTNT
jgi:signal-transduction protein with cAMP-binding, CBS, and nucleotidyltransferase domain